MPWKEICVMEEKAKFIADYLNGYYSKSELCRVYGIARRTGYKIIARYNAEGLKGLENRSRAPINHHNAVNKETEELILKTRGKFPTWGPKKISAYIKTKNKNCILPSVSSIGNIIKRNGLVKSRKRKHRSTPYTQPFKACKEINSTWCIDFKGWFYTGDGTKCYPLTVTDAHSRFLLKCEGLKDPDFENTKRIMDACFREYGIPETIRSDNGPPFATVGIESLSQFTIWLTKLGITHERIAPGKPCQNGRHERMHFTLKNETTKPPMQTMREQQRLFHKFQEIFNYERPHEALGQITPGSIYQKSDRAYIIKIKRYVYSADMILRTVRKQGQFDWKGKRIFIGKALSREEIGLKFKTGSIWTIYFRDKEIGEFNEKKLTIKQRTKKLTKKLRRITKDKN
jgi:putative transposase